MADLGLAKQLDTESMLTGENVVGTPMYFAPEQTRSGQAVGTNLDLWAVGIMIFHCVTGTLPLAKLGDSLEVIVHEIRTKTPRRLADTYGSNPPPHLPYLQSVVDKALVKDPAKRVQTADEMLGLVAKIPLTFTQASDSAPAAAGPERPEPGVGAAQAPSPAQQNDALLKAKEAEAAEAAHEEATRARAGASCRDRRCLPARVAARISGLVPSGRSWSKHVGACGWQARVGFRGRGARMSAD